MKRVALVIPTYNERDNLPRLIRDIFNLAIPQLSVIIADDNSSDGTGDLAEELAREYPVHVLHRAEKLGMGTAYVHAFKHVLAMEPRFDYVMQMDADLSHNPSFIPDFLKKVEQCDVVLGSRYIPGGSIQDWGFLRRMVSRCGNFYARSILHVPYRDLTGGFKCFRREVLESLSLDSLSSLGYNFQIEMTFQAHRKGFHICETPILFTDRAAGKSKFHLGIMIEAFWKVLLLRFRK
ncbi:MAG: dolichyl-phosphate beta-D-mannosyltransferase [Candidatus Harrisonbacteria bacterium CG10_big_fil_rev_8_21_14_0_10_42_17]|uniref:Dolichyl-phosphate beta-D-mannosyltransferase n=1 Tax=Candidatus Harrisonbacteria bacterium CG10_big_fil_rev_8_21_14_0_10_42_17 TaxID=1974584 RepID=A0A2M6WHS4_9BACT|nr:MAG: dolichyl-phosphate beta-D-mannosyltransferase [Candidatus Harrisonbacteria bacterium CG10_big_fil_rev_8_21_14_0_10_42_17]